MTQMRSGTPMGKRALDLLLALAALTVTAPVLLLAAVAVRLSSPGPVIFRQTRAGLRGHPFTIYKLRTMHVDDSRRLSQTSNAGPGVFAAGQVLRRLKIDELPQIFNVLLGDMSLVGPRPCMPQTAEEMPDWAKARFDMRPGLTGLAQINGNASITWEDRWRFDVEYVTRASLRLDLHILLKTVLVVIMGEDKFRKNA